MAHKCVLVCSTVSFTANEQIIWVLFVKLCGQIVTGMQWCVDMNSATLEWSLSGTMGGFLFVFFYYNCFAVALIGKDKIAILHEIHAK